jgi:hypothetical protein
MVSCTGLALILMGRAGEGVVRGLVLNVRILLFILAAGFLTAIFIFAW